MALISCPECKAQISAKAPTCPNCGAPISLGDKKAQRQGCAGFAAIAVGLFVLSIAGALMRDSGKEAGQLADQSKPDSNPVIDQRTGHAMIDFTKQVWLRKRSLVCESEAELEANHAGAPAKCIPAPMAMPVAVIESHGILDPAYRVRVIGMGQDVVELWAGLESLMNDPPNEDLMPDAHTRPSSKLTGKGGQKTKH